MTASELQEIVEQRMSDAAVAGRLACNLHSDSQVEQRHHDERRFSVEWQELGGVWRCTIRPSDNVAKRLAQVDIHDNSTVRIDCFEPCRVTISREEGILCLTRYK